MYMIVHIFLEQFPIMVTTEHQKRTESASNCSGFRKNCCHILYILSLLPSSYRYCLIMMTPPIPLKLLVLLNSNIFCVLSWLVVALVSVFVWRYYHHRLNKEHNRRQRKTFYTYCLVFWSLLIRFYFKESNTDVYQKNYTERKLM